MRVLGFFSFTEVTDPSAHEAYNVWHQLDHMPEQFTIEGITFGQRWVRSPRCQAAEAASGPLLDRFHYMTLYLMRDESVVPEFFALAKRLYAEDRFFAARRAAAVGPVRRSSGRGRRRACGVGRSRAVPALQRRLRRGGSARSTARHWSRAPGVAGAWQFTDAEHDARDGGLRRRRPLAGGRTPWRRRCRACGTAPGVGRAPGAS